MSFFFTKKYQKILRCQIYFFIICNFFGSRDHSYYVSMFWRFSDPPPPLVIKSKHIARPPLEYYVRWHQQKILIWVILLIEGFFYLDPRVVLGMNFLIPANLLFSIPIWNFFPFYIWTFLASHFYLKFHIPFILHNNQVLYFLLYSNNFFLVLNIFSQIFTRLYGVQTRLSEFFFQLQFASQLFGYTAKLRVLTYLVQKHMQAFSDCL